MVLSRRDHKNNSLWNPRVYNKSQAKPRLLLVVVLPTTTKRIPRMKMVREKRHILTAQHCSVPTGKSKTSSKTVHRSKIQFLQKKSKGLTLQSKKNAQTNAQLNSLARLFSSFTPGWTWHVLAGNSIAWNVAVEASEQILFWRKKTPKTHSSEWVVFLWVCSLDIFLFPMAPGFPWFLLLGLPEA